MTPRVLGQANEGLTNPVPEITATLLACRVAAGRGEDLVSRTPSRSFAGAAPTAARRCPPWCVTQHGVHLGEENWIHASEPLPVADGVRAQIVMSVDPDTGTTDGPSILIGAQEYTLTEARLLGNALIAAADSAAQIHHPSAPP